MKNKITQESQTVALLQRILDCAAEVGAGVVELERVPEGLEIIWRVGETGAGELLDPPALEAPLIELVVRRAGRRRKAEGSFTWAVQGQKRTIAVEEYDSFGEACFRLKLGRAG